MYTFNFKFDNSYLDLPPCFYTRLKPVPVRSPELVIFNDELSEELGLDFSSINFKEKSELFSGNTLLKEGGYFAEAYAGHQFGHFTMLGDGRAIVWGEHITPKKKRVDIQFKGSGRTPYSRGGDGRAVLGPMLREYIISESMYHLGISTTRSLAVVKTGEEVMRDRFLPGAILTRVADSHVRIGTFEYAASLNDLNITKSLLEYTVSRHYPELLDADNKAIAFLRKVMEKQASLIVDWMRVGFVHGVMNTDNVALSGETIDYGPCAFMDSYDPNIVFSSIDYHGRYSYKNQPIITQWNLIRLAETLVPLIDNDTQKAIGLAKEVVQEFTSIYQDKWLSMMRTRLGLFSQNKEDLALINELLEWMKTNNADYTNTFRKLNPFEKPSGKLYSCTRFNVWYERWKTILGKNKQSVNGTFCIMKKVNPAVIPRNHHVENAIAAATAGSFERVYALLNALTDPYKDNDRFIEYQLPPSPKERVYQTFCGT